MCVHVFWSNIENYNNEAFSIQFRSMYSKQKMESIKEGAYFDYFKFFSMNAAETIRKLETTFKDEISEDVFFNAGHMFKRVKTLLSSYQVLLMEIKDSCEFVEIPEFGVCIMKIFFQLMAIIKFMGKSIILRSGIDKTITDKEKRADQRHTIISASTADFYHNSIKPTVSPQAQQRENFRMKEMASHIINDIRKEVAIQQKQHKNDSLENDWTYEKISKGRQKLQEIQSSQSEAVLSETVNMLYKKSEHINSFINIVQTNIALQSKENSVDTYLKIKEQFDQDCVPRFENAKEKLNKLFKEHVVNYQNKKKNMMVNFECQVKLEDDDAPELKSKTSFHSNKKGSHSTSNDQVKKLKNQVKSLQEQNKALKVFIQQKCEQYQSLITRLRSQKISMLCKSNSDNKSVILDKYKSVTSKKSQSYIENIQNTDNISQAPSHFSVQSQNKQFFHTFDGSFNHVKKSKVSIAARGNRTKVKFHFNEKQLTFCSKIVNLTILRQDNQVIVSVSEEKTSQKIQTQFQKIQERPSQLECSFRDNSAQISQTRIMKHSKFKSKRQRTSLMINSEIKDSRQLMVQTDSGLKSKKSYHPLCSIASKKLSKKKEPSDYYVNTEPQSNSDARIQKKSSKENTRAKISIFQRIQKQNEKYFSNNQQRSEIFPIISIEPISLQPKQLKCIKFMEGIQIIELQSLINFERFDLVNIFFNEDNASNYQILNLTLLSKNNQYFTAYHNKNIVIKDISKSANNSYKNLSPKYPQKQQGLNIGQLMVNIIYKYLKFLRQSKKDYYQKNYHIIKNFIRFPYSSVHKKNENQWKKHETENNAIQFLQLKKCIYRILKLHTGCKPSQSSYDNSQSVTPSLSEKNSEQQGVCEHWHRFFNKIGLNLIQVNE